jgi:lipopolysaccharide transport system permease protein
MHVIWHTRHLLWYLVWRDLRQRYIGSAGGLLWALLQPLLTAAAYLFLFDVVFAVRLGDSNGTRHFGVYLLAGLIPWLALNEGVMRGMTSLVDAGGLLRKTALPLELFPAQAALASALLYLPIVALYAAALAVARGRLDLSLLLLPLWFLMQLSITFLLALVLAILAAALRDVMQVVGFLTTIWIFISPVFYPLDRVPQAFRAVVWLNPGTPLVIGYHAIILKGESPGVLAVGLLLAWITVLYLIGGALLRRSREHVVDWL